jgi:hypothetical protein
VAQTRNRENGNPGRDEHYADDVPDLHGHAPSARQDRGRYHSASKGPYGLHWVKRSMLQATAKYYINYSTKLFTSWQRWKADLRAFSAKRITPERPDG